VSPSPERAHLPRAQPAPCHIDQLQLGRASIREHELDPESATGAKTRVLIEAACGEDRWSTIGVSQNIIEASWLALCDGLELALLRPPADD